MRKALNSVQLGQPPKIAGPSDGQIDAVALPGAPLEAPAQARRSDFYRPVKRSVTIRLDADIIAWFKQHAPDGRYQTEINRILRRYVSATENPGG